MVLTSEQVSALNLGLKFRQSPSSLPILQLVAGCESAARSLERSNLQAGTSFRLACAQELTAKSDFAKVQHDCRHRKALKDLGHNESVVITTTDKGGKVVVLDSIQYSEMVLTHLEDPAYERIQEFPFGRDRIVLEDIVLCN